MNELIKIGHVLMFNSLQLINAFEITVGNTAMKNGLSENVDYRIEIG